MSLMLMQLDAANKKNADPLPPMNEEACPPPENTPISLYLHIPFCRSRCAYCDFITWAGKQKLIPHYLNALKREIRIFAGSFPPSERVHTIYFGGGTPSLLSIAQLTDLVNEIKRAFKVEADAEITLEANPCDITPEFADGAARCGVNRISLGMQSAIEEELRLMGRRHTFEQVAGAVETLRHAQIENISLDLIYGFPERSLQDWRITLERALSLRPMHLSLYALTIENGTALQKQIENGKLSPPDEDMAASMYESAAEILSEQGLRHYEVANWAIDYAHESRHNKQYWRCEPYIGLGAGAHGCWNHTRYVNMTQIESYIQKMADASDADAFPAAEEAIIQTKRIETQDFAMLGLRLLLEGINPSQFQRRFGIKLEDAFRLELRRLSQRNLIEVNESGNYVLRKEKILIANQAFMEFVDI